MITNLMIIVWGALIMAELKYQNEDDAAGSFYIVVAIISVICIIVGMKNGL